jgi:hypothetical protein
MLVDKTNKQKTKPAELENNALKRKNVVCVAALMIKKRLRLSEPNQQKRDFNSGTSAPK